MDPVAKVETVIVYISRRETQAQKDSVIRYRLTENGKQKCRDAAKRYYHKKRLEKLAKEAQTVTPPASLGETEGVQE